MPASTIPPLSAGPCGTPFGNTHTRERDRERERGDTHTHTEIERETPHLPSISTTFSGLQNCVTHTRAHTHTHLLFLPLSAAYTTFSTNTKSRSTPPSPSDAPRVVCDALSQRSDLYNSLVHFLIFFGLTKTHKLHPRRRAPKRPPPVGSRPPVWSHVSHLKMIHVS